MKHAVLLMAYGSPSRTEDVLEYLRGIYEGKEVPRYAIEENTKKYSMFEGKSPSNRIVESVSRKLSDALSTDGEYKVFLGNKHWKPTLDQAVRDIKEYGADEVVAIPLFPFPSDNVENSYSEPLRESIESHSLDLPLSVINGFNGSRLFLDSWKEILERCVCDFPEDALYLFSAHSLPTMRRTEEEYKESFMSTAAGLAKDLGMQHYAAAFQSRGKYGSSWLEPSVYDAFRSEAENSGEDLVAIPLGFIYDHLEILYDLDYEFGGEVRAAGKKYHRTELPNDGNTFIECMRDLVLGEISRN